MSDTKEESIRMDEISNENTANVGAEQTSLLDAGDNKQTLGAGILDSNMLDSDENNIPTYKIEEPEIDRQAELIRELFNSSEEGVLIIIHQIVHESSGINDMPRDERGFSVLHLCAEMNFLSVADILLDYGFDPLAYDLKGDIALEVAIRQHSDEMAALIISKTKPEIVRRLFGDTTLTDYDESNQAKKENTKIGLSRSKRSKAWSTFKSKLCVKVGDGIENRKRTTTKGHEKTCSKKNNSNSSRNLTHDEMKKMIYSEEEVFKMFDINEDIIETDMDETLEAVLGSLTEEKVNGQSTVFVKLLDEDENGLEPGVEGFNTKHYTVFHNLAVNKKMNAMVHPVIMLLADHKWQAWCRHKFARNSCLYLFSLFSFTYSIVVGTTAKEVTKYDDGLQRSRLAFEIIAFLFSLYTLCNEVRQIYRHCIDYCKQFFNWLELLSSALVLISLPLRYTREQAHWFVLAVAYLAWIMRIFKYANIFTQTGAYAEALKRILTADFFQFSALFLVVNMAFGGAFLLVLKGEGSLDAHGDTSSYFGILFVGLRIMVEAAPVGEYVGSGSYKTTGSFVYIVFMFVTIVVLLNILIAQLSDTYESVQTDCYKAARLNRAWNITRFERNELQFCQGQLQRIKHYIPYFSDVRMKRDHGKYTTVLERTHKTIQHIQKKQVRDALETLTIKRRVGKYNKSILDLLQDTRGAVLAGYERRSTFDSNGAGWEQNTGKVEGLERKVNEIQSDLRNVTQTLREMRQLLEGKLQGSPPKVVWTEEAQDK